MRIGLFPSTEHSIDKGIDSVELLGDISAKTKAFTLEKGVTGNQQELSLDGALVLLRKLSLDSFSKTEYKNGNFCFGIHFVLEGNYNFTNPESKTKVNISSGSYNLVQWPELVGFEKLKGKEYVSVEVFFAKEFLEDLLGTEHDSTFENFVDTSVEKPKCLWSEGRAIPGKLRQLLLEILHCSYTGSAKTNFIESQIRCLVIEVFLGKDNGMQEMDGGAQLSVLDKETIEKVSLYIKQNLKRKLTIKELSEMAGFNTTKLKSCFKKVFHTTIFKYITQLRMEKARALILEENFTIAQASYEVGYSNPQHFTVAFKKTMGYLPSSLLSTPI
ncbi:helix-turn-helix transcriptional regulator [Zobellia alginiliquefaciens]|uniref:helix-turn-helix transcriptional regulator n=1 Tax=Zobellia alginiliquefaciens TaxID=3032586 RepID=UPI0023E3DFA9|nr:AraC family transcriptional regulator [Zobellia alginiliquefaciens]